MFRMIHSSGGMWACVYGFVFGNGVGGMSGSKEAKGNTGE